MKPLLCMRLGRVGCERELVCRWLEGFCHASWINVWADRLARRGARGWHDLLAMGGGSRATRAGDC